MPAHLAVPHGAVEAGLAIQLALAQIPERKLEHVTAIEDALHRGAGVVARRADAVQGAVDMAAEAYSRDPRNIARKAEAYPLVRRQADGSPFDFEPHQLLHVHDALRAQHEQQCVGAACTGHRMARAAEGREVGFDRRVACFAAVAAAISAFTGRIQGTPAAK